MEILFLKKSSPSWFKIGKLDIIEDLTSVREESGCDLLLKKNITYGMPKEEIQKTYTSASLRDAEKIKEIEYVVIFCDL